MKVYGNSKRITPDTQAGNSETAYKDFSNSQDTFSEDHPGVPVKRPVRSILFADDEEPVRRLFKEALERFGYQVRLATNGNEAIALFLENPADLIITDIFMPEKDGHTLILEIKRDFPEVPIFAITGKKFYDTQMELDIARTLGAIKVFTKPCKLSQLITAIKELSV
ncbi:MAG: response regulator [Thermodesulfobacteriota bacterium]